MKHGKAIIIGTIASFVLYSLYASGKQIQHVRLFELANQSSDPVMIEQAIVVLEGRGEKLMADALRVRLRSLQK